MPNSRVAGSSIPYKSPISFGSESRSSASGTDVCIRKASSYALIRAASAGSSGYSTALRQLSRPTRSKPIRCSSSPKSPEGFSEVERIAWVDAQRHRVVGGSEVVAVPGVPVLAVAHRDELRQVLVERAQAVVDPGPQRGELAVEHVPAGVELRLGAVVVVGGVHRSHHGDVIGGHQCAEPNRSSRSRSGHTS